MNGHTQHGGESNADTELKEQGNPIVVLGSGAIIEMTPFNNPQVDQNDVAGKCERSQRACVAAADPGRSLWQPEGRLINRNQP